MSAFSFLCVRQDSAPVLNSVHRKLVIHEELAAPALKFSHCRSKTYSLYSNPTRKQINFLARTHKLKKLCNCIVFLICAPCRSRTPPGEYLQAFYGVWCATIFNPVGLVYFLQNETNETNETLIIHITSYFEMPRNAKNIGVSLFRKNQKTFTV